jgi:hypothetical protein
LTVAIASTIQLASRPMRAVDWVTLVAGWGGFVAALVAVFSARRK